MLSVTVEITNLSQTKKLEYRTWAGADVAFDRDYGSLVDNFANSYKRMSFGMHEPVARNERASIYPAKSLTDVLVFEPPVSQVQYLRLELPGDNFGGSGMIRIQIPAAMLSRR